MKKQEIIHQIRRLIVASDSFQQCLSLIDHMEHFSIQKEDDIYPPMMAGLVVTYAKNFNRSDGLGPLPGFFSKFSDCGFELAHSQLIDSRNKIYAHRDSAPHTFERKDGNVVEFPVDVWIDKNDHRLLFQPRLIDIAPARLPQIRALINFQLQRLKKDLDGKLAVVVDAKKEYEINRTYLLGDDFP